MEYCIDRSRGGQSARPDYRGTGGRHHCKFAHEHDNSDKGWSTMTSVAAREEWRGCCWATKVAAGQRTQNPGIWVMRLELCQLLGSLCVSVQVETRVTKNGCGCTSADRPTNALQRRV